MMPGRAAQEGERLDDRAYALMRSADGLTKRGRWLDAAHALEEAAEIHGQTGRSYDQARCLQMAETLQRSAGRPDLVRDQLSSASAAGAQDLHLLVSILTEQGETAFAQQRYEAAIAAYTNALREARQAGLKAEWLCAMLRRRAASSAATGAIRQANADMDEAFWLLDAASGRDVAAFVRTEQADLLWRAGAINEMAQTVAVLEAELSNEQLAPHLTAELGIMHARLARAAQKLRAAADYARCARTAALEAVAPLSYIAASVELAEALQAQGDYAGAYGALATAWATVSDVLGDETAGSWVEPVMLGFAARWGAPVFRTAKAEYEAQRRNRVRHRA